MKKYVTILFGLVILGIGLVGLWLSQDQKLDQTVFVQTTASIRNLQTHDYQLAALLPQAKLNRMFDHEQLFDTHYQISEEFDNLRYEALFEEIEGSRAMSEAVAQFEARFVEREQLLESFVESNIAVVKSLKETLNASESIQKFTSRSSDRDLALMSVLIAKNNHIQNQLISPERVEISADLAAPLIVRNFNHSGSTATIQQSVKAYNAAFDNLFEHYSNTQKHYESLRQLKTGPLLESIEIEYANYHNQAIISSNQFRNALLLYGALLILALLFFALQIRKNYRSLEQQIADRTRDIQNAYEQLQESQEQLIQSEKMASLGEMVAGVAHEINTPLGYVSSNVDTLKGNVADFSEIINGVERLLQIVRSPERSSQTVTAQVREILRAHKQLEATELSSESTQLIEDGLYGLGEISKLVLSLKDFARLDRQMSEQIDIHHCIENSLPIANGVIRENNVTVKTHFSDVPKITCIPSKLNQLFLNIITNACHAMKGSGGVLNIASSHSKDSVIVKFRDQGVGMNEQTRRKIFDPFFTTKEIGEGTGLGMSIAYKIVESHNGTIDVVSEPDEGCEVTIKLPIAA